jgi:hypothetical protein
MVTIRNVHPGFESGPYPTRELKRVGLAGDNEAKKIVLR